MKHDVVTAIRAWIKAREALDESWELPQGSVTPAEERVLYEELEATMRVLYEIAGVEFDADDEDDEDDDG